jgi:basic amino acid/polyamine antiporter, APA family
MSRLFARKSLEMLLEEMKGDNRLRRVLGPVMLTSLGVGAIIGTGIFVLTGVAAREHTGPALILSFVAAGVACVFAALCYAEFASMVPVAGSAYTYAYATLGELFAWIIGWDLVLEYTVASATVSHGWSHYFLNFLSIFKIHLPQYLTLAPYDYDQTGHVVASTYTYLNALGEQVTGRYLMDLPALFIALLITVILVVGIKESAGFNTVMVILKLIIVLMVIGVGAFYIKTANWHPFAPFGYTGLSFFGKWVWGDVSAAGKPLGMLAGAAVVFFAYIGFDSVSTHAEEAKNPQRDVPIGIIVSLLLCTVLYILVAAVLTGMVPYSEINIDAPVAEAFKSVGLTWAQFLIGLGAVAGMTSVILVLMLSQARVLLAMARDGLLPESFFGDVHPRFRTPWKGTIATGILVGIMGALVPLRILAELVNIGTLLAFVIVCVAVLIMRYRRPEQHRPFKAPFFPAVPILGAITCLLLMFSLPSENWWRLLIWLIIGFVIYFTYGHRHSVLAKKLDPPA